MHFRPVHTPKEDADSAAFSFERMNRMLDEGNRMREEEQKKAFAMLPILIRRGRFPEVRIARSRRYCDSIALIQEEEVRLLYFWTRIRANAIDLSVHHLGDLADELGYFERQVVAGDSFIRTSDSRACHGELTISCASGRYELAVDDDFLGRIAIVLDLFQIRALITALRSFGTGNGGWSKIHRIP